MSGDGRDTDGVELPDVKIEIVGYAKGTGEPLRITVVGDVTEAPALRPAVAAQGAGAPAYAMSEERWVNLQGYDPNAPRIVASF